MAKSTTLILLVVIFLASALVYGQAPSCPSRAPIDVVFLVSQPSVSSQQVLFVNQIIRSLIPYSGIRASVASYADMPKNLTSDLQSLIGSTATSPATTVAPNVALNNHAATLFRSPANTTKYIVWMLPTSTAAADTKVAAQIKNSGIKLITACFGSSSYLGQNSFPDAAYSYNIAQTSADIAASKIAKVIRSKDLEVCHLLGNGHYITFDGAQYSFQGYGEYHLVRSAYNDQRFYVQVRQLQCIGALTGATCPRAFAVADANDNVVFLYEASTNTLEIVINGSEKKIMKSISLTNGGITVKPLANGGYNVVASFKNGNKAEFKFRTAGSSAYVSLNSVFSGSVTGLCGNMNGCADDDFVSSSGSYLGSNNNTSAINTLGEQAHVVWDEMSLFNYATYYQKFEQSTWVPLTTVTNLPQNTVCQKSSNPFYFTYGFENTTSSAFLTSSCNYDVYVHGDATHALPAYDAVFDACRSYCDEGVVSNAAVIDASACKDFCFAYTWTEWVHDYRYYFNGTGLPPVTLLGNMNQNSVVNFNPVYGVGGKYTFELAATDLCRTLEPVTATAEIICDIAPIINAGPSQTVSMDRTGYPEITMNGTITTSSTRDITISWRIIQWPTAEGTTSIDYSFIPIYGINTANPRWTPEYNGTYILEMAVFDNCTVVYSNVTVTTLPPSTCAPIVRLDAIPTIIWSAYNWKDWNVYERIANGAKSVFSPSYLYIELSTDADGTIMSYIYDVTGVRSTNKSIDAPIASTYQSKTTRAFKIYNTTSESVVRTTVGAQTTVTPTNTVKTDPFKLYNLYGLDIAKNNVTLTSSTTNYTVTQDDLILRSQRTDLCTLHFADIDRVYPKLYAQRSKSIDYTTGFVDTGCVDTYTARATVIDDLNAQGVAQADFSVRCGAIPKAVAGCDQTKYFDYAAKNFPSITLNGGNSFSAESQTLFYRWTITQQPVGSVLSFTGGYNTNAKITGLQLDKKGNYTFNLDVSDGCAMDTQSVRVQASCRYDAPVVDTPQVSFFQENQTMYLTSFATTKSSVSLTYKWEVVSYPPRYSGFLSPLAAVTGQNATFKLAMQGEYSFLLTVTDGCETSTKTVVYTVQCPNTLTINDMSQSNNNLTREGGVWPGVKLNASPSNIDLVSSMQWALITKPLGSLTTLAIPAVQKTTVAFTPDKAGSYVIQTAVNDQCNWVTGRITIKAVCGAPIHARTLAPLTLTYSSVAQPSANLGTLIEVDGGSAVEYTYTWVVSKKPSSSSLTLHSSDRNPLVLFDVQGTYVLTVYVSDGCQTTSTAVTVTIICPFKLAVSAGASQTIVYKKNGFPKVELQGSVSAIDFDDSYVTGTTWTFVGAPQYSGYVPVNEATTTNQIVSQSWRTTFNATHDLRRTINSNITTTTSNTKYTVLNNDSGSTSYGKYAACFIPDYPGVYTVNLWATDSCVSESATVDIIAVCNNTPNITAVINNNQDVVLTNNLDFTRVVLDATGTTDPEGDDLNIRWELVSFPSNSLMYNRSVGLYETYAVTNWNASYASMLVDVAGEYSVKLIATDGCSSVSQVYTFTVKCDANVAISVLGSQERAGNVLTYSMPLSVNFTNRCPVTSYSWKLVSYTKPQEVLATLSSASALSLSFASIAISALFVLFVHLF